MDAILTFNVKDEHGAWIPTRINIGSWITLQPGGRGAHACDAAEHGGPTSFEGAYKAKVLQFRMRKGSRTLLDVLVQHAYMQRQLHVDIEFLQGKCNCKNELFFFFVCCGFSSCFHFYAVDYHCYLRISFQVLT